MKRKIILTIAGSAMLALSAGAFAATPGAFIGIDIGWATLNTPGHSAFDLTSAVVSHSSSRHIGGFSYGLNGGYYINKNFGVVAAFLAPRNSEYKGELDGNHAKLTYRGYLAEILARANLPIGDGFELFVQGGGSYLSQKVSLSNPNAIPLHTPHFSNTIKLGDHSYSGVLPVVGAGAVYDIDKNLSLNVTASHAFGRGDFKDDDNALASISSLTFGASCAIT